MRSVRRPRSKQRAVAKWIEPQRGNCAANEQNRKYHLSPHLSGQYVLSIKKRHGGEQETEYVCAADAAIVQKAVPRRDRLQNVAPEIHIGREKVGPQVPKELNPPDDVQHDVYGQSRNYRH